MQAGCLHRPDLGRKPGLGVSGRTPRHRVLAQGLGPGALAQSPAPPHSTLWGSQSWGSDLEQVAAAGWCSTSPPLYPGAARLLDVLWNLGDGPHFLPSPFLRPADSPWQGLLRMGPAVLALALETAVLGQGNRNPVSPCLPLATLHRHPTY